MTIGGDHGALAARISDIASIKHNLSVSGSGPVGAAGEKEICAFCHTPHGANNFPGSPLWNRDVSGETYTVYSSASLDTEAIRDSVLAQPAGSSKLCLSCHDGTLAINVVNVLSGQQNVTIPMSGLAPWNGNSGGYIGSLTMYCSDCHGTDTAAGTVEPNGGENGNPWGPHGSSNNFILKGNWDHETGTGQQSDLCFKCHDYDNYANPNNGGPAQSGFRGSGTNCMGPFSFAATNLHIGHADRIGRLECTWCHVAVPHGWRNKALLVDISQEGANEPYTSGPYYAEAMLGGGGAVNWQASGNWTAGDCGGRMRMQMSCGNPP